MTSTNWDFDVGNWNIREAVKIKHGKIVDMCQKGGRGVITSDFYETMTNLRG